MRVDERRWVEAGPSVDEFDFPLAAVDEPVVAAAQQDQVVQLRCAMNVVGGGSGRSWLP